MSTARTPDGTESAGDLEFMLEELLTRAQNIAAKLYGGRIWISIASHECPIFNQVPDSGEWELGGSPQAKHRWKTKYIRRSRLDEGAIMVGLHEIESESKAHYSGVKEND